MLYLYINLLWSRPLFNRSEDGLLNHCFDVQDNRRFCLRCPRGTALQWKYHLSVPRVLTLLQRENEFKHAFPVPSCKLPQVIGNTSSSVDRQRGSYIKTQLPPFLSCLRRQQIKIQGFNQAGTSAATRPIVNEWNSAIHYTFICLLSSIIKLKTEHAS